MDERNANHKRGAPRGNQNARKHSYYSLALKRKDKRDLQLAASIGGLDEEIALLRFKLKSLLEADPRNMKDFSQAILALNRLMRTQAKYTEKVKPGEALQRTMEKTFLAAAEMGLPVGFLPDNVGVPSHRIINPPGQRLGQHPPAVIENLHKD
ncbi:MAG: hypothetical protein HYX79_03565 [Chloroflexi bacterium]|nr:hypothetical protein [Chloroflexota bacterium]